MSTLSTRSQVTDVHISLINVCAHACVCVYDGRVLYSASPRARLLPVWLECNTECSHIQRKRSLNVLPHQLITLPHSLKLPPTCFPIEARPQLRSFSIFLWYIWRHSVAIIFKILYLCPRLV